MLDEDKRSGASASDGKLAFFHFLCWQRVLIAGPNKGWEMSQHAWKLFVNPNERC